MNSLVCRRHDGRDLPRRREAIEQYVHGCGENSTPEEGANEGIAAWG